MINTYIEFGSRNFCLGENQEFLSQRKSFIKLVKDIFQCYIINVSFTSYVALIRLKITMTTSFFDYQGL